MIKQLITILVGERKKLTHLDLTLISSILIKPIGNAIGDAIAHSAHLNQLKQFNPNIKLGVIVTDRNRIIFENIGLADELIDDVAKSYIQQRKKWDLYLDFQPTFNTKSIIFEKVLSPKYLIIFNKKAKKHYNIDTVKNYNAQIKLKDDTHISSYLSYSLFSKQLSQEKAIYTLKERKISEQLIQTYWQSKPYRILISPQGSGREIPINEQAELLNKIDPYIIERSHFLLSVVKNGEYYFSQLKNQIPNTVTLDLLPSTHINNYLDIICSATLIISVDSGTVHLACALNKPLLAFYANNQLNLNRWYPKNNLENQYQVIISQIESHSDHTSNFNMQQAANWLNNYLGK